MTHTSAGDDEIPHPIDPEHDVDGKKTAKMLIYWTIGFAFTIWLSYVFFDLVSEDELSRKVEKLPNADLNKLHENEKGELEAAGTRPSLEDAMRKYTQK